MTKKELLSLFQNARIDSTLAHRVYRERGQSTFQDLQRDPYTTLYGVSGFTLEHADKFSRLFKKPMEDLVLGHVLWSVLRQPSPESTLKIRIQTTLGLSAEMMNAILVALVEQGRVMCMHKYLLHPREYEMLQGIAKYIYQCTDRLDQHVGLVDAFDKIEGCDELQRDALDMVAYQRLSIITGGPGCGKSWIVRQMVESYPNSRVTAPTGRAARNADGKTVHYFKTIQETQKNELCGVDLIIIDEASMLSAYLFDAILSMIDHTAHVVLVGDPNQLPPIQTGHVLRDILASDEIAVESLMDNKRSVAPIHAFCKGLLEGLVVIPDGLDACVSFEECDTVEDMLNALPKVFQTTGIVLTPHNATRVQMNRVLQLFTRGMKATNFSLEVDCVASYGRLTKNRRAIAHVHPHKISVVDGLGESMELTYAEASRVIQPLGIPAESGTVIRRGDRVIITKNNADLCNGDMGTYMGDSLVKTDDGVYSVPTINDSDPGFALGYCITVHKAQGSEFETVIIPIANVNAWSKTLLYTAATRAKERIIFLGSINDLQCILRRPSDRHIPPFLHTMIQQQQR